MIDANGMFHDRRGRFARSAALFSKLDAPDGGDGGQSRPGAGSRVHGLIASLARTNSGGGLTLHGSDANMDWSSPRPGGGVGFEASGDDGETVQFDMSESELAGLHAALTEALSGDDPGYFGPGDENDSRFFDWSSKRSRLGDEVYDLEIGHTDEDGEDVATQMELTQSDMRDWHTALTVSLLTNELQDA